MQVDLDISDQVGLSIRNQAWVLGAKMNWALGIGIWAFGVRVAMGLQAG